jgi:hypothetical protein
MDKDNKNKGLENTDKKLHISDVSKRSELKSELASLYIELNSRYGAYGHIEPSLEQQKIIRDRIDDINEELKNVC